MKDLGKILISKKSFSEIVIGNTALVRAMIESGTKVITSYPGSPTPEIASAINSINKKDRPFYFEFSTNEKVATEVAFGASINGNLSTVFFKSVGLNVAADSFVQLSLLELIGGMIIILGDDPGANSSQNEQDNRHYANMTYTPVFEPSTPQETYEMYLEAAELSKKMKMPIILRLTTHVCHAKQKVTFREISSNSQNYNNDFDPINNSYIPITDLVFPMKENALKKLNKISEYSENSISNKIINNNSKKGIITYGGPFLSLMDIINDLKEKPNILKLGIVNPLSDNLILSFLKKHNEIKILEELDDILEKKITHIAYKNQLQVKIYGKNNLNEWLGEYTPDKVYEVLKNQWPEIFKNSNQECYSVSIPKRLAQMCPGCGHRSAFYSIKKALRKNDITVADIGCHTLGFLDPYNMGQVLLSMGHSNSTASGLSIKNENRNVVAFIGDSTLFHAGLPGIINAIFNKHNYTLIIMENGTTAMTGHQDHPGVGHNFNEPTHSINIKNMLKGLGVEAEEVDAYSQLKLTKLVKESFNKKGFKVIIAKHPCMLKFNRELRQKDNYIQRNVNINQDVCEHIYECIEEFACPTFQKDKNDNIFVHTDLCIGDASCIQTCPTKAIKQKNITKGSDSK